MACPVPDCGFVEGQNTDDTLLKHHQHSVHGRARTLRWCLTCKHHFSINTKPAHHRKSIGHLERLNEAATSAPYVEPSWSVNEDPEEAFRQQEALEDFHPAIDNFVSPFPPPFEFIPDCKLASKNIQAKAKYDKWSILTFVREEISPTLSTDNSSMLELTKDRRFDAHSVPKTAETRRNFVTQTLRLPLIYQVEIDGHLVYFYWVLDAVAWLLHHFSAEDGFVADYKPDWVHLPRTTECTSLSWFYAWLLSDRPPPNTFFMLMLAIFLDEFQVGAQNNRLKDLEATVRLQGLPEHHRNKTEVFSSLITRLASPSSSFLPRAPLSPLCIGSLYSQLSFSLKSRS